jgi:hypothetical protein
LVKEQKYIDILNPKYNINKYANSTLGTKHMPKTKNLLRILAMGRKHTEETKILMSISRLGDKILILENKFLKINVNIYEN